MSGRKLENSTYNVSTSWPDEVESKDILKKGFYNIDISNRESAYEAVILAGSSVEVDGVVYIFDSNETPTGLDSLVTGDVWAIVYESGGVAVVEYTQTEPEDFSQSKMGYYDSTGLKRYLYKFSIIVTDAISDGMKMWFDVDSGGSAPSSEGLTLKEVDILSTYSNNDITSVLATILGLGVSEWSASANNNILTVTNTDNGVTEDFNVSYSGLEVVVTANVTPGASSTQAVNTFTLSDDTTNSNSNYSSTYLYLYEPTVPKIIDISDEKIVMTNINPKEKVIIEGNNIISDYINNINKYLNYTVYTTEQIRHATTLIAYDYYGISIAVSDNFLVVGAIQDTGANGYIEVYTRLSSGRYDSGTKIVASDAQADDQFGSSVSISGDYIIVGASTEDQKGSNAGAAYIFYYSYGSWDAGTKIVASDGAAGDYFGSSVSISGDYVVVGAYGESTGGTNAGASYIFHRTGTNTWDGGVKQLGSVDDGVYFGSSVSISGDYVVVGAYGDSNEGFDAGASYIFHRTGTNTWDGGTIIYGYDIDANDQFGKSVSIDGDSLIVGAPGKYYTGIDDKSATGVVYIFHRTGTNTWDGDIKIHPLTGRPNDKFGTNIAINNNRIIVGVPLDYIIGTSNGAAYIFYYDGNNWDTGTKIIGDTVIAGDKFGSSVAIFGNNLAVGCYNYDKTFTKSGASFTYEMPDIWSI